MSMAITAFARAWALSFTTSAAGRESIVAHAAAKAYGDTPNVEGVEGAVTVETNEMLERNGYSGAKLQDLCDRTLKQLEQQWIASKAESFGVKPAL